MRRTLAYSLLAALLALAAAIGLLAYTDAGLRWALARLAAALPGELVIEEVRGRLAGPIELGGLRYRELGTELRLAHLSLEWAPTALLAGTLRITRLEARALELALPAATPSAPVRGKDWALPLALSVAQARLEDLAVRRADWPAPLALAHIELAGRWRAGTLEVTRLVLAREDLHATVRATFQPATGRLDGELDWSIRYPPYAPLVAGGGRFAGDLARLTLSQTITAPLAARLEAEVVGLDSAPRWSATLDIEKPAVLRLDASWPEVRLSGRVQADGGIAAFRTEGRFEVSHERLGTLHGTFRGLREPARWRLETLVLEHVSGARMQVHGEWREETARFALGVAWHALTWPLAAEPWLASPRGELRVAGSLEDYTLTASATLRWRDAPAVEVSGRGRGDRHGVRLTAVRASGFGGVLDARGRLGWTPALSWEATFSGSGLDPGQVWRDWPGRLDLAGQSRGTLAPVLAMETELTRVAGTLRGRPFALAAQLGIEAAHYRLERLELSAGRARLEISGERRAEHVALRWQLEAEDLSELLPRASGALSTSGRLQGTWHAPDVVATVRGRALAFEAHRLAAIEAAFDVDARDARDSRVTLAAEGLRLFAHEWQSLHLEATGRLARHRVRAALATAHDRLELELSGTLAPAAWRGALDAARFDSAAYGTWRTRQPAALAVHPATVQLEEWCWHQDESRLCLAGGWQRSGEFRAHVVLRGVPAGLLLAPLLPPQLMLGGTLDGEASVAMHTPRALLEGELALALSSGTLAYRSGGVALPAVEHHGGRLRAHAAQARVHLEAALALADGGRLQLEAAFPTALVGLGVPAADAPLSGRLAVELRDLSPATMLLPKIESPRGRFTAELRLAGSVAAPRVSGRASLAEAAFGVPDLGIQVRAAALEVRSSDGDTLAVSGQARSGEGTMRLEGEIDISEPHLWTARLTLQGEDFEALRTPELRLYASPQLTLQARPRVLHVEGELHIPQALIRPRDVRAAAIVSPDVVLLGAPQATPAVPAARWETTARVRVMLGDKVRLEGFDFKGWISGSVLAEDRPPRPTTGLGELRVVAGHYQAFGQALEVERGRLVFAGGPIDDPGLDLRAVRRVGAVSAGVQARGTLKAPELTLVSEPPMDQADILSYVMLGRPVEQATRAEGELLYRTAGLLGLAGGELLARRLGAVFGIEEVRIEPTGEYGEPALVLGTYLSPRIYVSYGVGLFETFNVLRIRYRLGKNWFLQTESGTAASGADLLYTIER